MEPFAPATAEQRFTIAISNQAALVLAAPLALAVAAEAPSVSLDFRAGIALDLADRLDRGELDLAIGETLRSAVASTTVGCIHDRLVALMRQGHPAAAPSALTLPTFAALPHLESNLRRRAHRVHRSGARARKSVAARGVAGALYAASMTLLDTDMVAVISERAARNLTRLMPLAIAPLPFPSPDLTTAMAGIVETETRRAIAGCAKS